MQIIRCTASMPDGLENKPISCLFSRKNAMVAVDRQNGHIYTCFAGNTPEQLKSCRLCDKLAWYSAEDKYYATSQKLPGYVFVLNTGFHEIDCLRPFLGSYTKQIVDQSNLSAQ